MLDRAHYFIQKAGKELGLSAEDIQKILDADAEHQFDIRIGDKTFPAFRVQHNNKRGPYKGGIRFHPGVDRDEVKALATLMSLKAAALNLPLGGGKGGVVVNPKQLSEAELEKLSRAYVRHLREHIGPSKDVPAPDVNTNAKIIDWMVDEYQELTGDTSGASFTGKSLKNGGSEGRTAATGRGGVVALDSLLRHLGLDGKITYAIQGFGNVGAYFATVAAADHPSWRLVAASDSGGTIQNLSGLNSKQLADYKLHGGRFADFRETPVENKSPEDIVSQEVDVLVLAALGDAVDISNAPNIKASYIVELANGPVSYESHDLLSKRGKIIIPDIIANAGGVVVSYLEWQQNQQGEHWTEDRVNELLHKYMKEAMEETLNVAGEKSFTLTEAAFYLSLKRLVS